MFRWCFAGILDVCAYVIAAERSGLKAIAAATTTPITTTSTLQLFEFRLEIIFAI